MLKYLATALILAGTALGQGTVNSGTTGQTAYYPSNGTAVSGSSNVLI